MNYLNIIYLFVFAGFAICIPVDKESNENQSLNINPHLEQNLKKLNSEYQRYINQVINALETDENFKKVLSNVTANDVKSNTFANNLNLVHHNIRNRLDELKRIHLDDLHTITRELHHLEQNKKQGRKWRTTKSHELEKIWQKYADHLDRKNPEQFTEEDLRRLIKKETESLHELDKEEEREFKINELEKEHQFQESIKNLNEEQKKEAIRKHEESKKHIPNLNVNIPGSKQQLEEVWKETDQLPESEFNLQTLFFLHDLNEDGYLDQQEVELLFEKEIQKIYNTSDPTLDVNQILYEYHRMREKFFKNADANRDGLVSLNELIELNKNPNFNTNEKYEPINQDQIYTQEDFRNYEQHRPEMINYQYGGFYLSPPNQYPYGNQYPYPHPSNNPHYYDASYVQPSQQPPHLNQYAQPSVHPGQPVHSGQQVHPGQLAYLQQGNYINPNPSDPQHIQYINQAHGQPVGNQQPYINTQQHQVNPNLQAPKLTAGNHPVSQQSLPPPPPVGYQQAYQPQAPNHGQPVGQPLGNHPAGQPIVNSASQAGRYSSSQPVQSVSQPSKQPSGQPPIQS